MKSELPWLLSELEAQPVWGSLPVAEAQMHACAHLHACEKIVCSDLLCCSTSCLGSLARGAEQGPLQGGLILIDTYLKCPDM